MHALYFCKYFTHNRQIEKNKKQNKLTKNGSEFTLYILHARFPGSEIITLQHAWPIKYCVEKKFTGNNKKIVYFNSSTLCTAAISTEEMKNKIIRMGYENTYCKHNI